ncbi:hypothetical protein B0H13DRAFT_1892377 [Mycena leptocephala]|nr:hypothetical protein B0H13DRAFT_1892377 [Mycena leptocephala]
MINVYRRWTSSTRTRLGKDAEQYVRSSGPRLHHVRSMFAAMRLRSLNAQKDKARGSQNERREEGKKRKNAPIPFHDPQIIVSLQQQVLIPNEPVPEICALEGVGNRGRGGTRRRARPGGGGMVGLSEECVHIRAERIEELPQQRGCTKVQTRAAELELEAGEFGGKVGMQTVERVVVLGVYHGLQSAVSVVDTFGAEIFDLGPYLADRQKGLIHVGLNTLCSRYNTAIAIILESGAVYCAAPIFLLITLSLENVHLNAQLYSIIGLGIVQQLINIIPTFTLVYIRLKNTTGGIGQVPSNSGICTNFGEWILNHMGLKKKNTRKIDMPHIRRKGSWRWQFPCLDRPPLSFIDNSGLIHSEPPLTEEIGIELRWPIFNIL